MDFDYLVVGAGFSGAIIAERLANLLNKKVLVIDKRNHIAGNAYDCSAENGVIYHKYGPHYFRTNNELVINYLSQFTQWIPADYKVKSYIGGFLYSFPINLNTFRELKHNINLTEKDFIGYLKKEKIDFAIITNSEEAILSQIGLELYEKFFKNYTFKQWKKYPSELDPSVCKRIPIRTNLDDRYFNDKFQYLPKNGYTSLIGNILDHPNIKIKLNTSFEDIDSKVFTHIFFSGPIDEYFNYIFDELPYRSLRFENQYFNDIGVDNFAQKALQINYPNEFEYTRTVEIKHISDQKIKNSLITYEYPLDWKIGLDPYYPIPCKESNDQYKKYLELAKEVSDKITFIGRLGTYRYNNMDVVIAAAINEFNKYITRL